MRNLKPFGKKVYFIAIVTVILNKSLFWYINIKLTTNKIFSGTILWHELQSSTNVTSCFGDGKVGLTSEKEMFGVKTSNSTSII